MLHHNFRTTHRHGKFMFAKLSSDTWILFHFGMTGDFRYERADLPIKKHDRLVIFFSNGGKLNYVSQRKLGKISTVTSPQHYMEARHFGPDALQIDFSTFRTRIHHRKRAIKSALLEQSIVAGIGNLYADEVLFQAKIHPSKPVKSLSVTQLKMLLTKIQSILSISITNHANFSDYPDYFFIHSRDFDGHCPQCAGKLQHLKIGGRTSIFCPNCQIE